MSRLKRQRSATLLLHRMNRVELAELYYAVSSAIEMRERGSSAGIYFPLDHRSIVVRAAKVVSDSLTAHEDFQGFSQES